MKVSIASLLAFVRYTFATLWITSVAREDAENGSYRLEQRLNEIGFTGFEDLNQIQQTINRAERDLAESWEKFNGLRFLSFMLTAAVWGSFQGLTYTGTPLIMMAVGVAHSIFILAAIGWRSALLPIRFGSQQPPQPNPKKAWQLFCVSAVTHLYYLVAIYFAHRHEDIYGCAAWVITISVYSLVTLIAAAGSIWLSTSIPVDVIYHQGWLKTVKHVQKLRQLYDNGFYETRRTL